MAFLPLSQYAKKRDPRHRVRPSKFRNGGDRLGLMINFVDAGGTASNPLSPAAARLSSSKFDAPGDCI